MWSIASSDQRDEESLPLPIEIRPIRNARRMRLRLDDRRGVLKLTCPARTSRRIALRWALEQRDWIDAQLARRIADEPFVPGAIIPLDGRDVVLVADCAPHRTTRLDHDRLIVGGPEAGFARRVETFLRTRALAVMSDEVAEFAALAGAGVRSVSIGDAATRWGSCSSRRRIRLSWRLILASPAVRRFVVAHEVAHLRHLDHGPAFRLLEAELVGTGLAEAKAALKREGPRLRRLGRGR
ncbi:MAG: YgjP-like metallopeptidase domain-containing protein [Sphingomicrobium sp.]